MNLGFLVNLEFLVNLGFLVNLVNPGCLVNLVNPGCLGNLGFLVNLGDLGNLAEFSVILEKCISLDITVLFAGAGASMRWGDDSKHANVTAIAMGRRLCNIRQKNKYLCLLFPDGPCTKEPVLDILVQFFL